MDENDFETQYVNGQAVWEGGMQSYKPSAYQYPRLLVNVNMLQYHTIATLYTSDGATAIWQCQWVDPNPSYSTGFVGCTSIRPPNGGPIYAERDRTYLLSTALNPPQSSGGVQSYPMNLWITNFQIWSCSNVGSGRRHRRWSGLGPRSPGHTCPGTMITHWPLP